MYDWLFPSFFFSVNIFLLLLCWWEVVIFCLVSSKISRFIGKINHCQVSLPPFSFLALYLVHDISSLGSTGLLREETSRSSASVLKKGEGSYWWVRFKGIRGTMKSGNFLALDPKCISKHGHSNSSFHGVGGFWSPGCFFCEEGAATSILPLHISLSPAATPLRQPQKMRKPLQLKAFFGWVFLLLCWSQTRVILLGVGARASVRTKACLACLPKGKNSWV